MAIWFRFYQSALDDRRVQKMPPDLFKFWVNALCLTSRNGGSLPSLEDISFALRITEIDAERYLSDLVDIGLLLRDLDGNLIPEDWHDRQFLDKTNAQRQRAYRERQKSRNALRNVSVTSQEGDREGDRDYPHQKNVNYK